MKNELIEFYENDLRKVIAEINAYQNEEDLWILDGQISNSAGNLALHLIGNINHFFGAVLGGTGYQRERDLEFSSRNVTRQDIVKRLKQSIVVLRETLSNLSDEAFTSDYPGEFGKDVQKTETVAVYMLSHLNYHLGQINYHRRLFSK